MIKILIAEDHHILREGLVALLNEEKEIQIVAEASNGKEVIEKLSGSDIDLVLMDIQMPLMDGFETTRCIRENFSQVKILILSNFDHESYVSEMFDTGVNGYMLKNAGKEELLYAIKTIHAGSLYLSPAITVRILAKLQSAQSQRKNQELLVPLSKRETEVLHLMSEGLTNHEISEKLFTSRRTVETHRKNLIEKTGSKNTASLIRFAFMQGLIK